VPFIVVQRRRGVAPDDLLPVNLGHDGDMLSDWESERVVGVGQTESVDGGVMREGLFLHERERAPFDGVEHLSRDGWCQWAIRIE